MKNTLFAGAVTAFVLTACGGGGGGDGNNSPPAPVATKTDAAGIYTGTDTVSDTITGVVLDTGAYYFVYTNSGTSKLGVVQGTATASSGSFKSTDAKDFYIGQNTVLNDNVTATYTAKSSINGTITPASGSGAGISFTGTYSSVYDQAPSLTSLAGTYVGAAGSVKTAENVTVTIKSDGTISGSGVSTCSFTGTTTPHATGNVYDATIKFGGSPCLYPNQTISGVLLVNNNELIAVAPLSDRSDAFLLAAAHQTPSQ
ncbi:hypothetical protein [Paraburkholderia xenovorans]